MGSILTWYLVTLFAGILFWPLSRLIFRSFRDGGWAFSRSLGILVPGFILWVLSVLKVLPFRFYGCLLAFVPIIAADLYLILRDRKKKTLFAGISFKWILTEELVFLGVFLIAVWIVGFKPEAYGTEKLMDYAFMTSMMRCDYLPFTDTWWSGEVINYYYGGQYFAAFLTKLSGVTAGCGYNLMRATITSLSFVLPFALVKEIMADHLVRVRQTWNKGCRRLSAAAGLLSGCAVAFCGNFHYVIYGIIKPLIASFTGEEYSYWFPDSTRFIGYDPVTNDKTIHEFPAYSSVLGDLHAHYINIIFVLVMIALLYAWAKKREHDVIRSEPSLKELLKEALLDPCLILMGFLTGLFRWTNFWDFPIYLVVALMVIFFVQLRVYRRDIFRLVINLALNAAEIVVVGFLAALPFTANFDMISSSIGLCSTHTALIQLIILWGLPIGVFLFFFALLIVERRRQRLASPGQKASLGGFLHRMSTEDLVVFLFGVCAFGLVLVPEIVYVKDIYTGDYYRANTMFKMTYQAFILFGVAFGYMLVRLLQEARKIFWIAGLCGTICLCLTGGYIIQSVYSWFGNVFDASRRISTDASVYISESFSTDLAAVNWLNTNVSGQPVVLEAQGVSYSECERISAATGLPTVCGWYTHEWLWRGDTEALNERCADVKTIYTSTDEEEVRALIEKYDITYIYIGVTERSTYENINDTLLQSLGQVAYSDGQTTYIMKVQ